MANVEEFARQKDLEHIVPQLKKGALLAQSPVSSGGKVFVEKVEAGSLELREPVGRLTRGIPSSVDFPPFPLHSKTTRPSQSLPTRRRNSSVEKLPTSGPTHVPSTLPSSSAPLARPSKDGIRQDQTVQTCPSPRSSASLAVAVTSGSLVLSTLPLTSPPLDWDAGSPIPSTDSSDDVVLSSSQP